MVVPNIISGNVTSFISNNLLQLLVAPNIFFNLSYSKPNNHESDWSRFDQENFVFDDFSVNWDNLLLSSNTNTQKLFKTFLQNFSLYFTLILYLPEINTREEHNVNEHNIILIKILKLLNKDISDQLAILFN